MSQGILQSGIDIVTYMKIDPDQPRALLMGRLWGNLRLCKSRPHTDDEWEQFLKHCAYPNDYPCPEAFIPSENYDRVIAVLEEMYQEAP